MQSDNIIQKINLELEDIWENINKSSHHAFILESDNREDIFEYLKMNIEKESHNENNFFLNLKIFDLDKAEKLINYGKIGLKEKRFALISFYSANREAQNSLLKFLEETPENLKIIFLVHSGANILSTILSRLLKLDFSKSEILVENEFDKIANLFLKTKKLDRMKLKEIKDLLDRKDEYALEYEDKERGDREVVESFLISLSKNIFSEYKSTGNTELLNQISELEEFLKYIKINSSSSKTILEYLAYKL